MSVKTKAVSLKNHFKRNKNAYTVAAVTVPVIVMQAKGISKLNDFLKENNLFETYYLSDEDED